MTRFKVTSKVKLLATITLVIAVLTVAVVLYLQNLKKVYPCKWDSTLHLQEDNTCYKQCGPPYTPTDTHWGYDIDGKMWFFCCPKGLMLDARLNKYDPVCVEHL